MTEGSLPSDSRPGRVVLDVAELDRLVEFYESVVGLETLEHDGDGAILGVDGDPLLELHSAPETPDRGDDEAGLFHIALRVPSRAALGAALNRIEREWELTGASDHRVSEALYFRDPENNGVEIYCDRPEAEWPTTEGGRVAMDTLHLDLGELRDLALDAVDLPPETTMGHVHLETTSLPAAREFYVETVGLNVRQEFGSSALFLAAGDYHHHLGVNGWNGRTAPHHGRGIRWFELVVPEAGALDALRDRLVDAGRDPVAVSGGIEVVDPDGIGVRFRTAD